MIYESRWYTCAIKALVCNIQYLRTADRDRQGNYNTERNFVLSLQKSLSEGATILRYTCLAYHFCLRIHTVVSSERYSEYQNVLPIYHGNYRSLNMRYISRPRIFCTENWTGLYILTVGQVDIQKEGSQIFLYLNDWYFWIILLLLIYMKGRKLI